MMDIEIYREKGGLKVISRSRYFFIEKSKHTETGYKYTSENCSSALLDKIFMFQYMHQLINRFTVT